MTITTANTERTGWRDAALSARLREYRVYVTDVDDLWCTLLYKNAAAAAVIEYRHHEQAEPLRGLPSLRALANLWVPGPVTPVNLPLLIARYWTSPWAFEVWPWNPPAVELAKRMGWHGLKGGAWVRPTCATWIPLSERDWVGAMRRAEGTSIAPLDDGYSTSLPPYDELMSSLGN